MQIFGNRRRDRTSIGRKAADSVDALVAVGSEAYDRFRHLPRILPMGPEELADVSAGGRRKTLARLARALRAERNRGRAGHWTYDLNRHIALAQAYQAERRLLAEKPPS
ncbi:MAG: DUF6477 family protein [Bauldia sp.]|jgi:hypothetical protein|nr:DUF6477 family protein [Bauldia sp.]